VKFDPAKQSAHAEVAKLAALYGPEMTPDEQRAQRQRVAAEMARAEARRRSEPQLDLPE
jgi:hypothetical protein